MALVDYDESSGDEDYCEYDEKSEKEGRINLEGLAPSIDDESKINKSDHTVTKTKTIKDLPIPQSSNQDILWKPSSKKCDIKTHSVKILAPQIPEDDPEDLKTKCFKHPIAGSCLLEMLPKPKSQVTRPLTRLSSNQKQAKLIPDSVLRKTSTKKIKNVPHPHESSSRLDYTDSDDDEDATGSDFFKLNEEKSDLSISKLLHQSDPTCSQDNMQLNDPRPSFSKDASETCDNLGLSEVEGSSDSTDKNNSLPIDDNAMAQLCGGSQAKRRRHESIALIEIKGENLEREALEWRRKELSKMQKRPVHKKNRSPTSQQKRKHQITYLAYQAKEQELELTNQWANNRMTRKQTQAKYGF